MLALRRLTTYIYFRTMCFDIEILLHLLKVEKQHYDENTIDSSFKFRECFKLDRDSSQGSKKARPRTSTGDKEAWISFPITVLTNAEVFRNLKYLNAAELVKRAILEHKWVIVTAFIEQSVREKLLTCPSIDLHQTLERVRVSFEVNTHSVQIQPLVDNELLAETKSELLSDLFQEEIFSCTGSTKLSRIPSPVMANPMFSPSGDASFSPIICTWPTIRTYDEPFDAFEILRSFTTRQTFFKIWFWNDGSKEISRKSRSKRLCILWNSSLLRDTLFTISNRFPARLLRDTINSPLTSRDVEKLLRVLKVLEVPVTSSILEDDNQGSKLQKPIENDTGILSLCENSLYNGTFLLDLPTRKSTKVWIIRSRYDNSREIARRKGSLLNPSDNILICDDDSRDSETSFLDECLLSDVECMGGEKNKNALEELLQMQANIQERQAYGLQIDGPSNGPLPSSPHRTNVQGNITENVPVTVSQSLVCSPWSVKVAEYCIQKMPKGVIYMPPPLSVLPILAVVMNSYLSEALRDHRVVVVCESSSDVIFGVSSYLTSSFGERYSVERVTRDDFAEFPRLAPLSTTTARVVILDSFDFCFSSTFVLLIVLISEPSILSSSKKPFSRLSAQSARMEAHWMKISSMLVASLDPWVELRGYLEATNRFRLLLDLPCALFVKESGDIQDALLMSRPRVIFLVPSLIIMELIGTLEKYACRYLQLYEDVRKSKKSSQEMLSYSPTSSLKMVNLRFLKKIVEERDEQEAGISQLELLYYLRQARSYALYDGADTALDYLKHCIKQCDGNSVGIIQSLLKDIANFLPTIKKTADWQHPIVKALSSYLKKAAVEMKMDAPSLTSIHRRHQFRPLVLANSREAIHEFLTEIENAQPFSKVGVAKTGVTVCALKDLTSQCKIGGRKNSNMSKNLEQFSHVIHVIDDRGEEHYDVILPAEIMQFVHAGRTRLLTIAVDETRELDRLWKQNEYVYRKLGAALDKCHVGDTENKTCYIQEVLPESIVEAMVKILPKANVDDAASGRIRVRNPNMAGAMVKPKKRARLLGELHLTATEVQYMTIASLRRRIVQHKKLSQASPLHLIIHVAMDEKCTPAVTYVHAAICSNLELHKNTRVITAFSL